MTKIMQMKKEHFEESVDIFMSVFSKEPWNDKYSSKEQVINYFYSFEKNNYFKGYVLIINEKIIGLSLGLLTPNLDGWDYFIHEFCIDSDYQEQKKGSLFLDLIKKEVFKDHITSIILTTTKNFPSEYFYKKNGFLEENNSLLLRYEPSDIKEEV